MIISANQIFHCLSLYLLPLICSHREQGGVHCIGNVYAEAVWDLYKRHLPEMYGYDDNTAMEIVTRLTYIAAGKTYDVFLVESIIAVYFSSIFPSLGPQFLTKSQIHCFSGIIASWFSLNEAPNQSVGGVMAFSCVSLTNP